MSVCELAYILVVWLSFPLALLLIPLTAIALIILIIILLGYFLKKQPNWYFKAFLWFWALLMIICFLSWRYNYEVTCHSGWSHSLGGCWCPEEWIKREEERVQREVFTDENVRQERLMQHKKLMDQERAALQKHQLNKTH